MKYPQALNSISNLTSVLQGEGKYEMVKEMNQQILEGGEKVLRIKHPDILTSVHCLASPIHNRQRYDDACYLSQSFGSISKTLSPYHAQHGNAPGIICP